jgi:hypothetical protein
MFAGKQPGVDVIQQEPLSTRCPRKVVAGQSAHQFLEAFSVAICLSIDARDSPPIGHTGETPPPCPPRD